MHNRTHVSLCHHDVPVRKPRHEPTYDYHAGLWLHYREPLLPIALLLSPKGEGIDLAMHAGLERLLIQALRVTNPADLPTCPELTEGRRYARPAR